MFQRTDVFILIVSVFCLVAAIILNHFLRVMKSDLSGNKIENEEGLQKFVAEFHSNIISINPPATTGDPAGIVCFTTLPLPRTYTCIPRRSIR